MKRKISLKDTGSIAAMHKGGISEAFFSKLGRNFLIYLYSSFIKQDSFFGYVSAGKNRKINGVITIASGRSFFSGFLKSNFIPFFYHTLIGIMLHPSAVLDLLRTSMCLIKDDVNAQSELFSIAIDEREQGKGIGTSLMEEAKKELHSKGIRDMKVLVDARLKANAFYISNGFLLIKSVKSLGRKINIYKLKI